MILRTVLATSLTLPLVASAATPSDAKFAYVDLQRALLEIEEGRQAKAKLQKLLDQKQKDLDKEQEALRKEKELLEKQASAMSDEVKVQKATDLQRKLFELAQRWEKGKAEMANLERTELQGIFAKMDPIIATIAQREGLTMVFEKTDSGLVYAPPALDLTNEVVRTYNSQNKSKKAAEKAPEKKAEQKDAPKK